MYANAGCIDDLPLRRHDLEEIESAQTVSGFPSTGAGLRELARALERTAIVVESRWAEIPEPIRRLLELSVYTTTSNRFSVRFSLKRFGLFAKCAFILAQIDKRVYQIECSPAAYKIVSEAVQTSAHKLFHSLRYFWWIPQFLC